MVQITPLIYAIPVFSYFSSADSTSGLVARQSSNPSYLPPSCQSSCQVFATLANCKGDLSCECTFTVGSQYQECMNCLVSIDPVVKADAQSVINSWNQACGRNLSLGGGSGSGSGSTTSSTTPATTTGTTSSGGGSSSPLGSKAGGALELRSSSVAVCMVAALTSAFVLL